MNEFIRIHSKMMVVGCKTSYITVHLGNSLVITLVLGYISYSYIPVRG